MLLGTVFKVLASASVAFGHVVRRNESAALDALEHAALSRLPNVPLPDQISNSTITILQLMTIFLEFDAATYTGVLDSIARNMTGYTDFNVWTREEVVGILQRHQAYTDLTLNYTVTLLETYRVPLIPQACTYSFPLSGVALANDLLGIEQINTLLIDAMQDFSRPISAAGDHAMLPILWSLATGIAEQLGFYRLFQNLYPAERTFLTSVPPNLAYSTFAQVLASCPFPLDAILPLAAPMFEDPINGGEAFTYCTKLARVPADVSKLSLSIMVGDQLPITVPIRNVELNGTIIFFDSDFPRNEAIVEGLSVVALNEAPVGSDDDAVGSETLASTFIQWTTDYLVGFVPTPGPGDGASCPRAGGADSFWAAVADATAT